MKARTRVRRILSAGALGATLALSLPTGALAEHDARKGGHERGLRGDHHRGHEYRHGRFDRHRRHYRSNVRHHRPYPIRYHGSPCRPEHVWSGYTYSCRPCGHRFTNLSLLHQHVHHHHHVPLWRLPFVIVAKTMSFVFYG